MKAYQSVFKTVSMIWDVNIDGGGVGVYDAGISIPMNCQGVSTFYRILSTVNGVPASTFGLATTNNGVPDIFNTFGALFNTGDNIANGACKLVTTTDIYLYFVIANQPFTRGKILIGVNYIETRQ